MNHAVFTIMKKELSRFFGDKRMVMTTVILPGLMIFLMYQFVGTALSEQLETKEENQIQIQAVNLPDSIDAVAKQSHITMQGIAKNSESQAKQQVKNQEMDLFMEFPADFDKQVTEYDIQNGKEAPAVKIYYNEASNDSIAAFQLMSQLLEGYEGSLCNKFDVNPGEEEYNLATDKDTAGSALSSMLPMLLLMFLYSGCVSVAPESIAGEKERGTIATLLITPVKRGNIALGKITALSLIALLSGASSTLGTILSLPKMLQMDESVSTNVYDFTDYVLLAIVILSTVLLLVTAISIISAFAKTVKEAQTYVTPVMVVVLLVGISAMFGEGAKTEWYYYLVPLYNSVQSMAGIFAFEAAPVQIVLTTVSNILATGIGVFILTRMFHSEKVIFSR